MAESLTIIGASGRAAAQSARRAQLAPIVGDLFADVDLCDLCPTIRVNDYPHGLERVLRGPQSGGWIYTGALENYPELIDHWSRIRPLYGNGADVLRRVRDPFQVADRLRQADLLCPDVARSHVGLPRDGSWLRKPVRSAGGSRIVPWTDIATVQSCDYPTYFQELIAGASCSAVYVAAKTDAVLIGVTYQLLTSSFRYLGSIGPMLLADSIRETFAKLGRTLAVEFDLEGLFGVDAVLNEAGVWPVEINPRYTASIEVLERSLEIDAIAMHIAACREGSLPTYINVNAQRVVGKAIAFASDDCIVNVDLGEIIEGISDVPAVGTHVRCHSPIATVLCEGRTHDEVQQSLDAALQKLFQVMIPANRTATGHV